MSAWDLYDDDYNANREFVREWKDEIIESWDAPRQEYSAEFLAACRVSEQLWATTRIARHAQQKVINDMLVADAVGCPVLRYGEYPPYSRKVCNGEIIRDGVCRSHWLGRRR